ncbi:MAG: exodeoxyribonuclease III [Acidobacteria bacterium]|nr:MAG: exodeoxyribonuclease III [Acidobacteriota bacterium]
MKLITWNVNGIRARHAQLMELMEREQPDVVCLQEIKASPAQVPEFPIHSSLAGDYRTYWHGSGGYSGVALLVKRSATSSLDVTHPAFDFEFRIATAVIGGVRVASTYVPNGGKDYDAKIRFLNGLVTFAEAARAAKEAVVICGDLNVALTDRDIHTKERKPNQIGARPEERALIARLIDTGLIDVGRTLDPGNDNLFTWWPPWRGLRQKNIGWRIDYILAAAPWGPTAKTCISMREFGTSDHAPVMATFA